MTKNESGIVAYLQNADETVSKKLPEMKNQDDSFLVGCVSERPGGL